MAITINERPYTFTPVGQKMIVRVNSSNVGNSGFKYYFTIELENGQTLEFYVSPNPNNQGIFDLRPVLLSYVANIDPLQIAATVITTNINLPDYPVWGYTCKVYEAWLVDGVLTPAEGSIETFDAFTFLGSYNALQGYRPDPAGRYGFSGATSLMMGDRTPTTYTVQETLTNVTTNVSNRVVIPTRDNELDLGVLCVLCEASGGDNSFGRGLYANFVLTKADGTTVDYNQQITTASRIVYLPAYPANLNGGGLGDVNPSLNAGWQNYTVQLFSGNPDLGGTVASAQYVFVPVESDCVYDNVRLCWWSPVKGGFDFFNFSKLNEKSVSVERKRIKRILGDYNTNSNFTFSPSDRGLEETEVKPTTSLEITSDWVQQGEFALLENLVRSRYVWIVDDTTTLCTPVVVDTNSFLVDNKRDGKLKRVTMRLTYSNENFAY